jgi:hypothetical protein
MTASATWFGDDSWAAAIGRDVRGELAHDLRTSGDMRPLSIARSAVAGVDRVEKRAQRRQHTHQLVVVLPRRRHPDGIHIVNGHAQGLPQIRRIHRDNQTEPVRPLGLAW